MSNLMNGYTEVNWKGVKKMLSYLTASGDYELRCFRDKDPNTRIILTGWVDVDWDANILSFLNWLVLVEAIHPGYIYFRG